MQIYTYLHTIKTNRFLHIFMCWLIAVITFSQTKPAIQNPWDKQITYFQKAENEAEKLSRINSLSEQIVFELRANGTLNLPDSSSIHTIKSSDSKVSVHYFVADLKENVRQLHLFILFERNAKRTVAYTVEELKPSALPKGNAQRPPLKVDLHLQTTSKDTIYQLTAKEGSQIIMEPIADLYTKGLFEAMVTSVNDDEKLAINTEITQRLAIFWNDPSTFENPFKGFNRLSVLISPDKKVKLFTWNTQMTDASHRFWGTLCVRQHASEVAVHPLIDKTDEIRIPERAALTPKKWYGAIYYDLVETEFNKQKFYTLIGFKGNTEFTKLKVIDVLTVTPNNDAKFNSAIVGKANGYVPRAVFEYSLQANMMLKYDANHQMIVMDNLTPASPQYKEIYMYYGPDFSYNGLKFEKGKWVFYPDIDLRNPKTR